MFHQLNYKHVFSQYLIDHLGCLQFTSGYFFMKICRNEIAESKNMYNFKILKIYIENYLSEKLNQVTSSLSNSCAHFSQAHQCWLL